MSNDPRQLTRDQLKEFLPNQRAIRAFEELFKQVAVVIPGDVTDNATQIQELFSSFLMVNSKADSLLAEFSRIADTLDIIAARTPILPPQPEEVAPRVQSVQIQDETPYVAPPSISTMPDYDTGVWVPVDASGAGLGLTVTDAIYTRVGNVVTLAASITYPVTISVLSAAIGGLPYPCRTNLSGTTSTWNDSGLDFTLSATGSTLLFKVNSGANRTNMNLSGRFINFSLTYITS